MFELETSWNSLSIKYKHGQKNQYVETGSVKSINGDMGILDKSINSSISKTLRERARRRWLAALIAASKDKQLEIVGHLLGSNQITSDVDTKSAEKTTGNS